LTGQSGSGKTSYLLERLSAADADGVAGAGGVTGAAGFVDETGAAGFVHATDAAGFADATGAAGFVDAAGAASFVDAADATGFVHAAVPSLATAVGFVSPGRFENGVKTGIEALLLPSHERFLLAEPTERVTPPTSPTQGLAWAFNPQSVEKVNAHLRSLADLVRGRYAGRTLVIDEIGPLEFHHGQGLKAALELLDQAAYANALVVIRPSLLAQAQARWQDAYDQLEVCEP